MTTDTSEKGLEALIVRAMTGEVDVLEPARSPSDTTTPLVGGTGWILGDPEQYDRGVCVDLDQLCGFVSNTQPEVAEALSLDADTAIRRKFLSRLDKELGRRGVVDVLRKGVDHEAVHVDLFYGTPSPENDKAVERFNCNRYSVTRQRRYSHDETRRALYLANAHQWAADRDLRVEEQPHRAGGRRRYRTVPPGPRSSRSLGRARPVRGPFHCRRRGSVLHRAQGQGLVSTSAQPGLQRSSPEDRADLRAHASPDRGRRRPETSDHCPLVHG